MTVEEIISRTRARLKGEMTHEEAFGVFPVALSSPPSQEQRAKMGQKKPLVKESFEDPFAENPKR